MSQLKELKNLAESLHFLGKKLEKKRTAFYDDSNFNSIVHIGKNKMKNDIFYVIIDTLCSNLNERKAAYLVINKNFGFLFDLNRSDTLSVRQSALNIVSIYTEDLNTSFVEEVIQFKKITESFHNNDLSMNGLLKKLSNSPLKATFPNVLIILRIFACMPCTNAIGERSFSVLRRVKNYLRSTLSQDKTSSLSLLSIENEMLRSIDWSSIIKEFVNKKIRKKIF